MNSQLDVFEPREMALQLLVFAGFRDDVRF
jgi:hypothetical protein